MRVSLFPSKIALCCQSSQSFSSFVPSFNISILLFSQSLKQVHFPLFPTIFSFFPPNPHETLNNRFTLVLCLCNQGVSKTQTSKTQTSDPKNSDPLGVSKTQTLKTQTLWVSRKLRPEKLRPSGCLENSDPKDKTNLDSECQRMLQAVLFTVRRYLNVLRK